MKSLQNIPRAAFTLIELLVVISIIALLASIAVPTANIVMRKAKETQARAGMAGLIIGIKAYQTEYNRFPDPTGNAQGDTMIELNGGGGDNDLMKILHPDQSASPPKTNPRRINFYDPQPAKKGNNGFDVDTGALFDPWGAGDKDKHIYRVAMDYGGDGAIDQSVDPTGGTTNIQTTVIAWSTGQPINPPQENQGTDAAAAKYFLCSWK